jgi:hypothetical protein
VTTACAVLQIVGLALDPDPLAWVQVTSWGVLAATWWLLMDTVVDDDGIRTQGRWLRERIAWADVKRFAVDSVGKPEIVLTSGQRRRLPYVPNSAWLEIQQRWQRQ